MTESSQLPQTPITKEQLIAFLDERRRLLLQEVETLIATALEPITAALAALEESAVQYGESVSLRAAEGMFICTEDGGPKEERQPFTLTSRIENAGAWESFEVVRGQ